LLQSFPSLISRPLSSGGTSGNRMALLAVSKRALQGPRSKKRALQYWERETFYPGKESVSEYHAIPLGVRNNKFAAEAPGYG